MNFKALHYDLNTRVVISQSNKFPVTYYICHMTAHYGTVCVQYVCMYVS